MKKLKKNDIVSFEDADVNGNVVLLSGKVSHISMGIVYVERCGKIYHCKVDADRYSHCYNIPSVAN